MSIIIYTYRDPYRLDQEPYWDEIKACPYFCASQTMVNGLRSIYKKAFPQGRVTTVRNLIEVLFERWESTAAIVKQHAAIDNIISDGFSESLDTDVKENIFRAFLFNRGDVFESIRTLLELNLSIPEIQKDYLTTEQMFILEIFRKINDSEARKDFKIDSVADEAELDKKIRETLGRTYHGEQIEVAVDTMDTVVIHGVHQFSPIMLRAIEILSKYKKVILLFNYQAQYKKAYQTWIDIYTAFDRPIRTFEGREFTPSLDYPVSYEGNLLADNLGKLVNGQTEAISRRKPCEVLEFDNMTEFASYVADIFEAAKKENPLNPMGKMREQIYAADSSVNDILKIYFPEQFGERQFLDYPLGHFFLAIANMWDPVENEILITDVNDIKECFQAGILKEDYFGELSSIYGKISALFEGCTSIHDMLKRLTKLRKNKRYLTDGDMKEAVSHISYYSISAEEIQKMEQALKDLDEVASYFYEDFDKQAHNFRKFYRRLKKYLQEDVLADHEMGEEFADIIRRVLDRLEEVEDIDTSASFDCLKATMSIYLIQETKPGKSANWIVRDFEQIDGDIIRSRDAKVGSGVPVYHFACLSDEDINSSRKPEFPWPLNDDFFEVAQEPIDWKSQVYVKSRREYKNYKRYALLYGLEFNRAKFKLSYVRRDGEKERSLYYLLKILGAHVTRYEESRENKYLEDTSAIQTCGKSRGTYNRYDYYRYRICKYRFLLESLVEGTTIYKDSFLLIKYLEVLVENQLREQLQGYPVSEIMVINKLDDILDELKRYFPFIQSVNRMDVVNTVRNRILNSKQKRFAILTEEDRRIMMLKELFIHDRLSDPKNFKNNILSDKFPDVSDEEIAEHLSEENLRHMFRKTPEVWCLYCANRENCAACYTVENM